ncbi:MAG: hypothetical protein E7L09_05825 [Enterobacteriaceae bacterium]|nr:hypothetical protein [Enterobacteriaceae bacterium]DAM64884.1 MAG TPA: DNA-directed RNA polymerase [Caudoviricetes sp.]
MKAEITTLSEQFFHCPECDSPEFSFDHLSTGSSFGPWYCDKCGCGIVGEIILGGVEIHIHSDRKAKTLVLLKLDKEIDTPVHIVVEGMIFYPRNSKPIINQEHESYFYNEHTCPWNYLRVSIKDGDETDPHGIFRHQETVIMPDWYEGDLSGVEKWESLFPTLKEHQS